MNADYMENLNKSEAYKLVAIGKNDSVTKSVKLFVNDKKCKLVVSVTGTYKEHTDGIGIYKVIPNSVNKFLFKTPVKAIHEQEHSSYQSTIELPPGNYYLVPYGGGKDNHGNFGVIYKPRNIDYTCRDRNIKYITVKADVAEY